MSLTALDHVTRNHVAALAVALFVGLVHLALVASGTWQSASLVLLATFTMLAIIEHLFLVLPISDSALWRWAINGSGQL